MKDFSHNTIGPGGSDDPVERRRQVAAQERLVSARCDILEAVPEWELEEACEQEGER